MTTALTQVSRARGAEDFFQQSSDHWHRPIGDSQDVGVDPGCCNAARTSCHNRLLVGEPQPCVVIVEVGGGAERLEDRHVRLFCRRPVGENGDVPTRVVRRSAMMTERQPVLSAQMGPDVVALKDAGRIGEDHHGVAAVVARALSAPLVQKCSSMSHRTSVRAAIACHPCEPHDPVPRRVVNGHCAWPRSAKRQHLKQQKDDREDRPDHAAHAPAARRPPSRHLASGTSTSDLQEAAGSGLVRPCRDRLRAPERPEIEQAAFPTAFARRRAPAPPASAVSAQGSRPSRASAERTVTTYPFRSSPTDA
jgi:hypothetical protein